MSFDQVSVERNFKRVTTPTDPDVDDRHLRKQFFELGLHYDSLHGIPSGAFHEQPVNVSTVSGSSANKTDRMGTIL